MLIFHLLFLWKEGYFAWTCSSIGLGDLVIASTCRFSFQFGKKPTCIGQYSCHHWNSESYHGFFNVWEGWKKAHIFFQVRCKDNKDHLISVTALENMQNTKTRNEQQEDALTHGSFYSQLPHLQAVTSATLREASKGLQQGWKTKAAHKSSLGLFVWRAPTWKHLFSLTPIC